MCPAWSDKVDFGWTDNVGRYNIVADERIQEASHLFSSDLVGLLKFCGGLLQAVGHLNVSTVQILFQLGIVIAAHAQGSVTGDQMVDDFEALQIFRTPVGDVPYEDNPTPFRVNSVLIAQLGQQLSKLIGTTVEIADDIEGAFHIFLVAPQAGPLDLKRF